MMPLPAIRGVLLEELVLHLLGLVGYRVVKAGDEGTRSGHSGLEVCGRGEWHQIDALAAFDRTPAFMYPLRLVLEAKCYARRRPVGIEVARNAVGVLKDISENYFSFPSTSAAGTEIQIPRFNYLSAIFSTSGYTSGAQRYAIAHQIFLIQYDRIGLLQPIVDGLLTLTADHLNTTMKQHAEALVSARLRREVRRLLEVGEYGQWPNDSVFSEAGYQHIWNNVVEPLLQIRGSYFGMLQGKWPMHLLSKHALPAAAFADRDEVLCRVYGRESDTWSFSPINTKEGDAGWFRLEFDIPEEILEVVETTRRDAVALAVLKQQQFSFLDLAGRIGGIQRQVRLRLDEEWLEAYLQRIKKRRQQ